MIHYMLYIPEYVFSITHRYATKSTVSEKKMANQGAYFYQIFFRALANFFPISALSLRSLHERLGLHSNNHQSACPEPAFRESFPSLTRQSYANPRQRSPPGTL